MHESMRPTISALQPQSQSQTRAAWTRPALRTLLIACVFAGAPLLPAQSPAVPASQPLPVPVSQPLPDAPSALLAQRSLNPAAQTPAIHSATPPPCRKAWYSLPEHAPPARSQPSAKQPITLCSGEDPLQIIVTSPHLPPLTPEQKGVLAIRDTIDPFNLITIAGYSGIVIGTNAHTAYGPGFRGFGKLTGYSFLEDTQSEFFGTFLIASLAREDPRYYRMPGRPIPHRVLHAVLHTFVSQHDDGSRMPNLDTLLTYPIDAELNNLYIPGVDVNAPSTAKRVGLGIATNPVGDLIAEFLPDIATHIHIRIIFVQQILQKVAAGPPNMVQ